MTDEMWDQRETRFPEHTPRTREYYLLRSLFIEQFPKPAALATVPKVRSSCTCSWHFALPCPVFVEFHDCHEACFAGSSLFLLFEVGNAQRVDLN